MKPAFLCMLSVCIAILPLDGFAQQPKPEDSILFRKAGHKVMAWNMGQIRRNLDTHYDPPQVAAWSNVIFAIADSGMEALFAPGTENDINGVETQTKSSYFIAPGVPALNATFIESTRTLAAVAADGNADAVNATWQEVSRQCQGCHA